MSILDAPAVSPTQFNQQLDTNNVAVLTMTDEDYRPMLNISRYTEDLSWLYYNFAKTMARGTQTKKAVVDGRMVTLRQVTAGDYYDALSIRFQPAGMTPFQTGSMYMVSMYVYAAEDVYFYMRPLSSSNISGQGPKFAKGGLLRRVWCIGRATSPYMLDLGRLPTVPYGSGEAADPTMIQQGFRALTETRGFFLGGIQIESIPSTSKDGIAWQGDSTMAGSSGKLDQIRDYTDPNAVEVSTIVAALTNASCFNRAVGGETLADMDARWATDINPLYSRCKYVIIQGGINDISQNRTLDQMKASMQSMVTKALTTGFEIRVLTCTPTVSIAATPAKEAMRKEFNVWIKETYGDKVIDIAPLVTDPETGNTLLPAFAGDGTHYPGVAKITIGRHIAKVGKFDLPKPSTYQRQQA